ncbi:YchF/TatD family DNA exonuclease [Orbaceae bacterium ESL0727]|nr:YchF/TatD family DNA exonuclease [Orbaceae bacterium ESL0727]
MSENRLFIVDSHCHLDSLDYQTKSIADVLQTAQERGVKHCLSVATTLSGYQTMRRQLHAYEQYDNEQCDGESSHRHTIPYLRRLSFSCGVHPLNLDDEPFDLALFSQLAQEDHVVALGETGLDYYYQQDNLAQQQNAFREHIRLGRQLNKPVIVHTRNARKDTLDILKEEQVLSGVLHCFTEDKETAKQLLDLGFYISFSGILTFKNAADLRDVARYVPLDRLLVETDSPYLAPVPYRGKENQPAHVREVAEYLAALRDVSLLTLAQQTTENFCQLFQLKKDCLDAK